MGKSRCGDHGGRTAKDQPCKKPAGWGTAQGEGRCKHHRPANGETRSAGIPTNGQTASAGHSDSSPPELAPPSYWPENAREKWNRIVGWLEEQGLAEVVDREALSHLVMAGHFADFAGMKLMKEGLLQTDPAHGKRQRKHPCFQIWRDSVRVFDRYAPRFGLTPPDRVELPGNQQSEAERKFMEEVLGLDLEE